ncbi:YfcC family protein [Paraclostridium bifermentans]|uniref:YfcC family protein n=1 Tax=Paraclostridium TaxID=1849822 RepID=UPI0012431F3E|nr:MULTISPECIES: YfcC family protein [Paraclostridium]MBZ6006727.1 YfcC family protein [Paraclostridium bifermentans]MDU0296237.1 YfcC family protein [Paraclostridium sp. MRS3W1]
MLNKKSKFKFPSAYTVLLAIMIFIALATQFVPGVKNAKLSDVVMAPVTGMIGVKDVNLESEINDSMNSGGVESALKTINSKEEALVSVTNVGQVKGAIDVSLFVLIIGGFLGVVTKTGALDAGVGGLVRRLKGKELMLIPVLMIIFSLGGTSYGMAEESLAFYALITATMIAAGFDPIVGASILLLGCGCGVLGSTVNPFAIGAAVSAAGAAGVQINQGTIIIIGIVLWIVTLSISIIYVMRYAKKVHLDKSNTILSKKEIMDANESFSRNKEEILELTGKRKSVLVLFVLSFVVMILGVVPWSDFGIKMFENSTAWLNGASLGSWWFPELTSWFFIMAVIIGLVYRMSERDIVSSFISGCEDMVGVALVIGISRGISFMMANAGLDIYILDKASGVLSGVSGILFANMAYIIYIGLSFLVPSTSGLASVSMPIFAPLAQKLNIAPEIVVSAFSAGSGIVNLITPTSGVVMGGLAISKIDYVTWVKFIGKLLLILFIATLLILAIMPVVLGI